MLRWYSMSTFWSKASGVPETSAITEWSMTSSTGTSGLTLRRVAAQRGQGVAHGGQVDHAGHAGEVLHEHPLGGEGDLGGVLAAEAVALGMVGPSRPPPRCRPARTATPSSWRRRFSRRTLIE